jgi:hypothetical protein
MLRSARPAQAEDAIVLEAPARLAEHLCWATKIGERVAENCVERVVLQRQVVRTLLALLIQKYKRERGRLVPLRVPRRQAAHAPHLQGKLEGVRVQVHDVESLQHGIQPHVLRQKPDAVHCPHAVYGHNALGPSS